jgi:L-alanine-DL-glutamate epimerase-like enolase superfamily enzyme
MKLSQLEIRKLEIPFRFSFKHSSAERSVTEAVIVVAESDASVKGYGEGCPRGYVTGESIASCMRFFEMCRDEILQIQDVESLRKWVSIHSQHIDANPAAWCAIETALLDLLGKAEGHSVEALLGIAEIFGDFTYSAVLGVASPRIFEAQCEQYRRFGLTDFKVKVCGELESDRSAIGTLTKLFPASRIRIDANNLWEDADAAASYILSLGCSPWAVEEPLKAADFPSLRTVAKALGCKIVLDESFLGLDTLDQIQDDLDIWVPNIRISKMGGLLRSLAIAEKCKQLDLNFIIGAQVGETSILTRMALSLASNYRDNVLAQEGAFGTYLLARDVTDVPIMFGEGGGLRANFIGLPGLGFDVDL